GASRVPVTSVTTRTNGASGRTVVSLSLLGGVEAGTWGIGVRGTPLGPTGPTGPPGPTPGPTPSPPKTKTLSCPSLVTSTSRPDAVSSTASALGWSGTSVLSRTNVLVTSNAPLFWLSCWTSPPSSATTKLLADNA